MRKLILSLLLPAFGLMTAQTLDFSVTDLDGNPYENGGVYVFNVHGEMGDEPGMDIKLPLVIHNDTGEMIYMMGQVLEMVNTDGTLAQFCIGGEQGNCYFPIYEGEYYPPSRFYVNAGEIQSIKDYFANFDPNSPVKYTFRLFQTDEDGFEIEGTNFQLTYEYEKPMAVNDLNSSDIVDVYPTYISAGSTTAELKEASTVRVLNTMGKVIKTIQLDSGKTVMNLSELPAGVYLLQFKGESGKISVKKVVVK